MELDHEFTIPVPVDRAWATLLDVERVAPCVPGAILDSVEGEEFVGRLKVKIGAMTITYRGTARIVKADEPAHTVTIEGSAKEARGSGTASATLQARLHPAEAAGTGEAGQATTVSVHTTLAVSGRSAQFGSNILSEVGDRLLTRFARALTAELAAETANNAAQATPQPAAEAAAEQAAEQAVAESPAAQSAPESVHAPEPVSTPEPAPAPEAAAPAPASQLPSAPEAVPAPEPVTAPEPVRDLATAAPVTPAEPAQPHKPAAEPTRSAAQTPEKQGEEAADPAETSRSSVAKRLAPVAAGLVTVLTVWKVFSRRRGRHHR